MIAYIFGVLTGTVIGLMVGFEIMWHLLEKNKIN
jgi:hypothetical protein